MAALSEAAGGATRGGAGDADAGADAGGPKAAVCEASTQTPPSYKGGLHRVILATCAATLCNVAFGYDVGVVSGSLNAMAQSLDLTTIEKEVATSGLNFLAGLGAIGKRRCGRVQLALVQGPQPRLRHVHEGWPRLDRMPASGAPKTTPKTTPRRSPP